jgi:PPM family protein phosphatase
MLRVAEAVQRTDTGRQREANEDAYFSRAPVFAVADGMGGAQAGEVASSVAVEAFEPDRDDRVAPEEYLRRTAQQANREIFELAQRDRERSGMGTTLTAAMLTGDDLAIGHVGDSRAYRWRDGELRQITNDHSLVEELRRQGKLTRDQAAEHPQRSVITRALGPEPEVEVDTMTVQAREGDVYLLCSDGLTTMLDDGDLAATLATDEDLDTKARRLVQAANERGGKDNITVVLFRVEEGSPEAARAAGAGAEDATLVGATASAAGLSGEAVQEAARGTATPFGRRERSVAAPSGHGRRRSSWRRRVFAALAALAILALLAAGAVIGARQVWFLGTDEGGRLALFRGLPYELPLGVDLYSESYSTPVSVEALPPERREVATDHELRSREDAVSLLEDLQQAAEEQAAAEREAARRATRGGSGGGADSGGGGQGGGGRR